MSKLDNNITITLSAHDMMQMLAFAEVTFSITGFPNESIQKAFQNFRMQVFMNCTNAGMDEALSELHVNNLMNDINNQNQ